MSHQPSRTSRSAPGAAQLCQYCNWPFQRLSKGPNERNYLPGFSMSYSFSSPRFLLAIDEWPAFPVLQERSLQGCEFCLFLREHLLSLDKPRPGNIDRWRVRVWVEFCWDLTRSLVSVHVSLSGSHRWRQTLSFSTDPAHGGLSHSSSIEDGNQKLTSYRQCRR